MSKLPSDRCVCAPQYLSAGTSIGPNASVSVLLSAAILIDVVANDLVEPVEDVVEASLDVMDAQLMLGRAGIFRGVVSGEVALLDRGQAWMLLYLAHVTICDDRAATRACAL